MPERTKSKRKNNTDSTMTIQSKLQQLNERLVKAKKKSVDLNQKKNGAATKLLKPIPFTNLGLWLVQLIEAVFDENTDHVRELVAGLEDNARMPAKI